MHAFITGATGFIGQHLLEQLLTQGWKVTALYRQQETLTPLLERLKSANIQWVKGNTEDIQSLRKAMPESVDAVFHLAANTSTWGLMHHRQYQTNVLGTQNMANVALEKHAIRFIHTSSSCVYGSHEDIIDELSEMHAVDHPVAYYRSKYLAEEAIREAIKLGLDAVILNPCPVIGTYDKNNWAQAFSIVANDHLSSAPPGKQSFCDAQDVAKAHIQAFVHGHTGENYILSGPDSSLLEIFQWICHRLGKEAPQTSLPSWAIKLVGFVGSMFSLISRKEPHISWDKAQILCSNSIVSCEKACRDLQYKPNKSIEEMLENSFHWWLAEQNTTHDQNTIHTASLSNSNSKNKSARSSNPSKAA